MNRWCNPVEIGHKPFGLLERIGVIEDRLPGTLRGDDRIHPVTAGERRSPGHDPPECRMPLFPGPQTAQHGGHDHHHGEQHRLTDPDPSDFFHIAARCQRRPSQDDGFPRQTSRRGIGKRPLRNDTRQ